MNSHTHKPDDTVKTLRNLKIRHLNINFISTYWIIYALPALGILTLLYFEWHRYTSGFFFLLALLLFIVTFLLMQFKWSYLARTQRSDILYLWAFPESGEPTSGAEPKENQKTSSKPPRLPVELSNIVQQVHYALNPDLHLAGLAPPPKGKQCVKYLDLKWSTAPYLLRSRDENEWQKGVMELLARCKGVVIECSFFRENLKTELKEVAEVISLDKVVLVCEAKHRSTAATIKEYLLNQVALHEQKKQNSGKKSKKGRKKSEAPRIIQRTGDGIQENTELQRDIVKWCLPIRDSHMPIVEVNRSIFRKRKVILRLFQLSGLGTFISILLGMYFLI